MSSLSDDSPLPRPQSRQRSARAWGLGLGLMAALLLVMGTLVVLALIRAWGGEVGLVHVALVLTAFFTGLMVLLAAALGWHAGVRLTRQRVAEPLRDAHQLLHLYSQLQPNWQWASDAGHRLVRWQAPQGAPASSWVGAGPSNECLWERFKPAAGSEAGLRARLDARQPFANLELSGQGRQWRLNGLPCHDGHGQFSGYVGTAVAVEQQPPQAGGADAERAAVLALEVESFSYSVSHDLRAPLRVVEGFARILKEDYGRLLDRIGNDHLDRVMGAAFRMNSMIDALLSLSQLSTRPLASQPVNLSQLAGFVMDELRRAAPARELAFHVEPGLVVQGDPTLLRMVMENLLANAWKYSAKVELSQIRFECTEQGGRRCFMVADNGAGFDMRFAERLFGVFQRLHSASDFQGTGVGLALVRRIVRRHGGEIWAESAVGEGARFYFTLA